jgi:hypothetical protein
MLTGELITPAAWQLALQVGDYYTIEAPIAGVGDGDRFTTFAMPPVYGRIESDEECQPGYFWVRAYSQECPQGESGSFNICEATRLISAEEFAAAKARGWQ